MSTLSQKNMLLNNSLERQKSSRLAVEKYNRNVITHPEVTPVFNCWKVHTFTQKIKRMIAEEDAQRERAGN